LPPSLNPLVPGFNPLAQGFNPLFSQQLDLNKAGSLDLSIPKSYYAFKGMDFEHLGQAHMRASRKDGEDDKSAPSSTGSSSSPVMNLAMAEHKRRLQEIDGLSDCSDPEDMGDYHSTGTDNDSQDNLLDDDDIDDELNDIDDEDDDEDDYDSSEASSRVKQGKEAFRESDNDQPASPAVSKAAVQEAEEKTPAAGVRKRKSQNPIKCLAGKSDTWRPYESGNPQGGKRSLSPGQESEHEREGTTRPASRSSVDLRMLNNNSLHHNNGPSKLEDQGQEASEYDGGGDGGQSQCQTVGLNHLETQGNFANSRHVMDGQHGLPLPLPSREGRDLLVQGPSSSGSGLTSSKSPILCSEAGHSDPEDKHDSASESDFFDDIEVPLDKENPNRCSACGKLFPNHFGVRTHYQSEHLKLLHKCTIEGCNAAFPSKRSRDRHASNLNLHRKLLSTGDERPPGLPDALRNDMLTRMYGLGVLPGLPSDSFTPEMRDKLIAAAKDPTLAGFPFLFPALMQGLAAPSNLPSNGESERQNNGNSDGARPVYVLEDDLPTPDRNGNMPCKFCHKAFPDGVGLKSHYETCHLSDLFPCTVPGCHKVFSSRRKRNCHSLNESQHLSI
jgi:hypothetical protein